MVSRVVDDRRAWTEQSQVAVHGVLIERNQQIDFVAEAGDPFRTGANRQKCMSAPNDRLICIVGVQVQAAPTENLGEDVARRGDTLPCRASDPNGKGLLHTSPCL